MASPGALDQMVGEVHVVDEVRRPREHVVVGLGARHDGLDAPSGPRAPFTTHAAQAGGEPLVDRARVAGVAAIPVGGEDRQARSSEPALGRPVPAVQRVAVGGAARAA